MNARIVRRVLWLLGFACLWLPVFDDPPLRSGAYLQDVTGTSAVVRMITAAPETLTWEVADIQGTVVTRGSTSGRRHEFNCTGLEAGYSYDYLARDAAGARRDGGHFRTPPANDLNAVRFCVLGDSGALPWWVWLQRSSLFWVPADREWLAPHSRVVEMGRRLAAEEPQFLLHLGDIVYPWGFAAHYSAGFFRPFAPVLRNAPCYAVLGNHDILNDHGRQAMANFRALPGQGGTGDGRCFSFAWGGVRVIGLDLNWGAVSDDVTKPPVGDFGPDHPSLVFLRQQLQVCGEPWVVVTSHFPIFSASRQGDHSDLIAYLLPVLRANRVDLYLSGHDHTYQRFGEDGELALVVSGGGGKSLYGVQQRPDAKVVLSQYHYCVVDVKGRELTLRACGLDGDTLDTLTVRLDRDRAEAKAKVLDAVNPARAGRLRALVR